jgi:hypothetical protein
MAISKRDEDDDTLQSFTLLFMDEFSAPLESREDIRLLT